MAQALPFLSLAATIGGTAASISQAAKSERRQERAQRISQRQASIENQRRIREAVAAARADREQLISSGFGAGVGFSSSVIQGGVGAADTQIASNVGFAKQNQAFGASINRSLQQANQAASRATQFQAIAGLPEAFGRDFGTDAASLKASIKGSFNRNTKPIQPVG